MALEPDSHSFESPGMNRLVAVAHSRPVVAGDIQPAVGGHSQPAVGGHSQVAAVTGSRRHRVVAEDNQPQSQAVAVDQVVGQAVGQAAVNRAVVQCCRRGQDTVAAPRSRR